ncbi:MAG TPA: type II toxin-antitoxin system YafQ family toxin [Thermoanaerobacterales bacterium]|jgi:mRNA interferase YafQ|nr:type II toxin-antitoxin system YafQ family toxin [Thermoanaerobacterales bacterium]
MSRQIVWTTQFKKDYKLAIKRGLNIILLDDCIHMLAAGEKLTSKFRDHSLSGRWTGFRECHIEPDWLLIYRIDDTAVTLVLTRTGSHSDLF